MVAAFRGDQWRTPQDGLAYIVLVERNRQRSMLSSSTDSTLLAQVQHVLGEDPEGQADLPIRLAPDARVCLDILSVRGRATIELQMLGPSSRAATQQGAMFTLRGHAQVVLRDDVIGMFLYRYGRPSTRAAAELKREMVAWAEQTLVANGAVAARPRPASEADPSVPKFGDFVYVEELPDPVTRVPPEYPDEARMLDISGTVTVNALVGRDGKVKETRVTQSIGLLDAAAEAAVRQWKFKPAKNKGAPVAVWVSVPVTFTLK
jgi:TonB family protein